MAIHHAKLKVEPGSMYQFRILMGYAPPIVRVQGCWGGLRSHGRRGDRVAEQPPANAWTYRPLGTPRGLV